MLKTVNSYYHQITDGQIWWISSVYFTRLLGFVFRFSLHSKLKRIMCVCECAALLFLFCFLRLHVKIGCLPLCRKIIRLEPRKQKMEIDTHTVRASIWPFPGRWPWQLDMCAKWGRFAGKRVVKAFSRIEKTGRARWKDVEGWNQIFAVHIISRDR
jgi:hypothetical protein